MTSGPKTAYIGLRFVTEKLGDVWEGGEKEVHQTRFCERVLHPQKKLQHVSWYRLTHLGFRMANLDRKPYVVPFPLSRADWKVSIHS